jgi:hypothetical protein
MAQAGVGEPLEIKVWCDGSADAAAGKISWACVSAGIEDHGRANAGQPSCRDPLISFGVEFRKASSNIAEAHGMLAAARLAGRIRDVLLTLWHGAAPPISIHIINDCQQLVHRLEARQLPKDVPEPLWEALNRLRDSGARFTFKPRVSTPELAFVDRLSNASLRSAHKTKVEFLIERAHLACAVRDSLGVGEDEAREMELLLVNLMPPRVPRKEVRTVDRRKIGPFRVRFEQAPSGTLHVAAVRGPVPDVEGPPDILYRITQAANKLGAGVPTGCWLAPRKGQGKHSLWRFDPCPVSAFRKGSSRARLREDEPEGELANSW